MGSGEEDEDSGDEEILPVNQQQVDKSLEPSNLRNELPGESEKRLAEKRKGKEYESTEDDDFITVNRKKPKRFIRSVLSETENMRVDAEKNVNFHDKHEVCITSVETMPKQMALAKLLRSENIKNIIRIKFKSFNKVLVKFQEKEDAIVLLNCIKLKEMGWRCQLINELSISYGVVKGVDLDISDEELMGIFESDTEITSIKRLKRVDSEGKWIDSESVRVGFKSKNLPLHIYAYGCRFKVESYVFPVTQCSGCWQFGHVIKYCPTKKKLCPKCGGDHVNCDINNFVCLNCKGDHLVIDKACPFFLKEKEIRNVMSSEQLTYRMALQKVIEKRQKNKYTSNDTSKNLIKPTNIEIRAENYASITSGNKIASIQNQEEFVEQSAQEEEEEMEVVQDQQYSTDNTTHTEHRNSGGRKKTKIRKSQNVLKQPIGKEIRKTLNEEHRQRNEELQYKFELKKFINKFKNIYKSEGTFEDKIILVIKVIYEEIKEMLLGRFLGGGIFGKLLDNLDG